MKHTKYTQKRRYIRSTIASIQTIYNHTNYTHMHSLEMPRTAPTQT